MQHGDDEDNRGRNSTTKKNSTFQSTPLQDVAKLTDVPGVGPKSAEKLKDINVDSPVKLMGNFMV